MIDREELEKRLSGLDAAVKQLVATQAENASAILHIAKTLGEMGTQLGIVEHGAGRLSRDQVVALRSTIRGVTGLLDQLHDKNLEMAAGLDDLQRLTSC